MTAMRPWLIGMISATLFVSVIATTLAQTSFWVPTNVPYGGAIHSLARSPNGSIFAGTYSGIYRTTDEGKTWTVSTRVAAHVGGKPLIVDAAGNVLAVARDTLWRSTDDGDSWEKIVEGNFWIGSLSLAGDGSVLAWGGGVFRSGDGGLTWEALGLQGARVYDVLLSPTYGLLATTNRGWGGLFRKNESDTGWTKLSSKSGSSMCEDPLGNLYVGGDFDGVHKSTDGGITWISTALKLPFKRHTLVALPTGEVFAGLSPFEPPLTGGVYRTTDGGETWGSFGLHEWPIYSLLAIDSVGIFAASQRGFFRLSDGGSTWDQANDGITATEILSLLCIDPGIVFAGTVEGLFRSTDSGQSWNESGAGIFPQWINCLASDKKNNLFAGNGVFSPDGGIYKSTDSGLSWRCTSSDSIRGDYLQVLHLLVTRENTIIAGLGDGSIYRSVDEGENWSLVRLDGGGVQFAADSAGQIYGWGRGGIIRSTDDGNSWLLVDGELPFADSRCLAARSANEIFAGGIRGVARSTNGGDSWTDISAGLTGLFSVGALSVDLRGDLLASTWPAGVYRTTDSGNSWNSETISLTGKGVRAFTSASRAMFATDTLRIYRKDSGPGQFSVSVTNNPGWEEIGDEGAVYLYDRLQQQVDSSVTASNGVAVFAAVPADTGYSYHVYRTSKMGDRVFGREYWGGRRGITVLEGQATSEQFVRNMPRNSNLHVYDETTGQDVTRGVVAPGRALRVTVDVSNPSSPGSALQKVKGQIVLDRDMVPPFDIDRIDSAYQAIPTGTTHVFEFRFTPASEGDYYGVTGTITEIKGAPMYTQSGRWITEPVVRVLAAPAAPFLAQPPDGATGVEEAPMIRWNTRELATGYHLVVSRDSLFTLSFVDTTISDTAFALPLLQPLSEYWWRVASVGSSGEGPFATPWRFTTREWLSAEDTRMPREFALAQNYPNPFNPSTTVQYALPTRSHVTLVVYNMLGEKVTELVNGEVEAGYHEARFDADGLASGVYLYRLSVTSSDPASARDSGGEAGAFVQTRRLVLVR